VKTCNEVERQLHVFLNSARDRDESGLSPARFTFAEIACPYPLGRTLGGGFIDYLDAVKKKEIICPCWESNYIATPIELLRLV
jgi:hypothetical protein